MTRKKIILSLVFLVLTGTIFFIAKIRFAQKTESVNNDKNTSQVSINTQAPFHAVFLDNNQVYFGRIKEENTEKLIIADVYYLKTNSAISSAQLQEKNLGETTKLLLVKLGQELHAPTDQITINKQHVLFYEEMKPDGTIIKEIMENEAKK